MHPLYCSVHFNKMFIDFGREHQKSSFDKNHDSGPFGSLARLKRSVSKIVRAIEMHMGPLWSPSEIVKQKWLVHNVPSVHSIEVLLFLCDYVASRDNIIVEV